MDPAAGDDRTTSILVVANPAAGGDSRTAAATVAERARDAGRPVRVVVTDHAGHATRLTAEAVDNGVGTVVAVGGDGTVNEVVNGMVDPAAGQPRAPGLRLGLVQAGTGADFARTFGLDVSPARAAGHVLGTTTMPIDLGRVRCVGPDGEPTTRVFANIADVGWAASVVDRAARLPRRVGRARYLLAALASARAMQPEPVAVTLDHTRRDDEVCQVLVANGQFFGAGFRIAPRALPDDGRFHVQTWGTRPSDLLRELPNVRVGEHLANPRVREWQSASVHVEPAGEPMRVEVDGEPVGTTPATIDVLPQVIGLAL